MCCKMITVNNTAKKGPDIDTCRCVVSYLIRLCFSRTRQFRSEDRLGYEATAFCKTSITFNGVRCQVLLSYLQPTSRAAEVRVSESSHQAHLRSQGVGRSTWVCVAVLCSRCIPGSAKTLSGTAYCTAVTGFCRSTLEALLQDQVRFM